MHWRWLVASRKVLFIPTDLAPLLEILLQVNITIIIHSLLYSFSGMAAADPSPSADYVAASTAAAFGVVRWGGSSREYCTTVLKVFHHPIWGYTCFT